ncbi:MAG: DUF436 domain-containing protein, partial [Defluviitaleaceae bacterium]|nr:DUF436 domain-containing protein [Defluviitaleaceae bacterium]
MNIENQIKDIFAEVIKAGGLGAGDIVVLGCSTSEILGGSIGKAGSSETGRAVVASAMEACRETGVFLAVQACEHINRALVVSAVCAKNYNLDIVRVVPAPSAGGSCAAAAFEMLDNAVVVEHITAHAGVDIGDT